MLIRFRFADVAGATLMLLRAAALLAALCGAAHAHAGFHTSTPGADAVLTALPDSVTLTFSEPVGPIALDWILPDGTEHSATAEVQGPTLRLSPPPDGGQGSYVLRWRVASADGHPVAGALVFSVGHVSGSAAATSDLATAPLAVAMRAAFVAALVLAVGGAVFSTLITASGPHTLRLTRLCAYGVAPLALLWIGAEGLDHLGLSPRHALSPEVWGAGFRAPQARSALLAALSVPFALLALRAGQRWTAFVAWTLAALSFAVSGHALSATGRIAPGLTMVHAGTLIFWIGGLPALLAALQGRTAPVAAHILRRFSALALPLVILLIGSGLGLIVIRDPGWATLETPWGRLLSLKLGLVAGMLVLALWHRLALTPALAGGRAPRVWPTLWAEIGLGLAVLLLAMGFRLAPPTHAVAPLPAAHIHLHGTKAMADIAVTGGAPGKVGYTITLADGDMAPLAPLEVHLALTDDATGIGPLKAEATRQPDGTWTAGLLLPTAGPWQMKLTVVITDFEVETLRGTP